MSGETRSPVPAPETIRPGNGINKSGLLQEGSLVNDLVIKPGVEFVKSIMPDEAKRALGINQGEPEKRPIIVQKQEAEEAPRAVRAANKTVFRRARAEAPTGLPARMDIRRINAIRSQLAAMPRAA